MSIQPASLFHSTVTNIPTKARILEEMIWQCMQQKKSISRELCSEFFLLLKNMPSPFDRQLYRPMSLFYLAIQQGYASIVAELIEFAKLEGYLPELMMEVDEPNKSNALHIVCEQMDCEEENLEIVSMLLEAGASPFDLDAAGYSPLHIAICSKKIQIADIIVQYVRETYSEAILSNLMNLQSGCIANETALHMSCSRIGSNAESAQIVSFLLEAGTSPFLLNSRGLSPLYCAAYYGNEKVVESLLRHAMNNGYLKEILEQKNGLNCPVTARQVAIHRNHEKISSMLLQAQFHIQAPEIFPFFPDKPISFPELEGNDEISCSTFHISEANDQFFSR